jgi:steroid Delta-isomerase
MSDRMSASVLEGLIEWYEHLAPERINEVSAYYAEDARFVDPFNDVVGVAAIAGIFRHMFEQVDAPRFKVEQVFDNGLAAMLVWRFEFLVGGKARDFQGATELQFDAAGRVSLHRDYWDPARELYEKLPIVGAFLRWLARRIAAPVVASDRP